MVDLIRRARRRFVANQILGHGATALAAGCGALVLLLVLGSGIVPWSILPLAILPTFLVLAWLGWRRAPSLYQIAQRVDRRLGLHDAISTAIYFQEPERERLARADVIAAQRTAAERAAESVDLTVALPYTVPRAAYALGFLFLLASSLLALRYGLERRLDLSPPLANVLHESFGFGKTPTERAALEKKKQAQPFPNESMGMTLDDLQKPEEPLDAAQENAPQPLEVPVDSENVVSADPRSQSAEAGDEPGEGELGEGIGESEGQEGSQSGEGAQGKPQSKQSNGEKQSGQQSASESENASLLAKLKEAMNNMLSKMKQQPQGGGQQSASNKQGQQQGQKGQQGQQGQKGASSQGQQGSEGQEGGEGEEGQSGESAQSAQNAQAKGTGQGAEDQGNKQPGSGMGKQDGAKDVKLAEQLAAMGKISEILGKRASNVSGEITVEVQQSSQQLKTPWARGAARHGESGGEISRDEVPIAYQSYVRQYFEELRKADAAKVAAPAEPEPAAVKPAPKPSITPVLPPTALDNGRSRSRKPTSLSQAR